MLMLELLVAWCVLSVPAALLVGAALYRSDNAVTRRREPSWEAAGRVGPLSA